MAKSSLELLEDLIADLEAKLNLAPGADPAVAADKKPQQQQNQQKKKEKKQAAKQNAGKAKGGAAAPVDPNLPDICKLEFKVGVITKAWVHPDADKLYCEEIDCGEEQPRQIASGLRAHYTLDEMQGQRLLVVSNLKAKNLVGFKSFGMVLCAAETNEDGTEKVEFVEPPADAPLGEVVTFEGLPPPAPFSASQVEKKKLFAACMGGMKTNDNCEGTFNGAVFMTSAGPCKAKSIKGGAMR